MQNLQADVEAALSGEAALVDEGGRLIKNAVVDRAARMDAGLLRLLMAAPSVRAHFFTDVDGTLVFDKAKFQEFVANKAFLPDSYTAFRNRIGLLDAGGRYLKDGQDVVLAWPYKDCVLEGGMTKEDAGRNELFWNTTLAPDDVTRLFEPKVLTRFERWDAEAVAAGEPKPVAAIGAHDNLLIKGNNLLALHSLKRRYAGQVKLIYIDPPYNTGGDGFRYNDRFNHSAWLTFMRNRLEVARELLRPDGAIFVNLDDNEAHYAKVLMDEVFGRDRHVATIAWQKRTSPDDRVILGDGFDTILVYGVAFASERSENGGTKTLFVKSANRLPLTEKQRAEYQNHDGDQRGPWVHRDFTAQNKKKNGQYGRQEQMYWVEAPGGARYFPPEGYCWKTVESEYVSLVNDGRMWFGKTGNNQPRRKKYLREENGIQSWTWWPHQDAGTNEEAKKELIALIGADEAQNFTPKPERLIERIVAIATRPGDLVLDFFAGSGTSAAVAHKMGRRWVAVEQMNYAEDTAAVRLKKVLAGEQGGISKAQNWQGGGAFVYCELLEWNEALARRIREASDEAALGRVIADVRAQGYWRYAVDQSSWDWDAFAALPFDQRRELLLDSLDANHLYVNYGDIGDAAFGVGAGDIAINRAFYEGEPGTPPPPLRGGSPPLSGEDV